jgi:hypothetical protein
MGMGDKTTTDGQRLVLVHDQSHDRENDPDDIEGLRNFTYVLHVASRLAALPTVTRRQVRRDLDTLHAELAEDAPRRHIVTVLFDEIDLALNGGQLPESVRIVLENGPHHGRTAGASDSDTGA